MPDTITIADVLKKIDEQLAPMPNGGEQAYVVLTRAEAAYLREAVIAVILERDDLVREHEAASQSHIREG